MAETEFPAAQPSIAVHNFSHKVLETSVEFQAVWSISMSRTFPRSCCSVSYAIKNQLVASKAPY